MADVKNGCAAGRPEALDEKSNRSIGHHVKGVQQATILPLLRLAIEDDQQDQVIENLRLPGGPLQASCAWNDQPVTAAGDDTVDAGAHDGEHHAGGEHVEYGGHVPPGELRPEEVDQRHKEHAAEQTHVADVAQIQRFQHRENLDGQNADQRVRHRQRNCRPPPHSQAVFVAEQPEEGE